MKLIDHATSNPDKPAVVMAGGETLTFSELEKKSAQLANLFSALGLEHGDNIAILLKNCCEYFIVAWAAQRSGLYYTPVNWHLSPEEASYIIEDCGAKVVFADGELTELAEGIRNKHSDLSGLFSINGSIDGYAPLDEALENYSTTPRDYEPAGSVMLYSSGTTGFPKGIKRALPDQDYGAPIRIEPMMANVWGFSTESTYLSPAPLYHSAPLSWSMGAHKFGCTVVVMPKFDAEDYLSLVSQYQITHSQCVPTMFIRLLNLPETVREQYDLSSIKALIHAAAPCPVHVKEQMLDWWGPRIYEFYSGSEWFGMCAITPQEWLEHKGSVGKSMQGDAHIVDESGNELPPGEVGTVYFENPQMNFQYHNAPEKTQSVMLKENWATYGDLGYLDEEGYLYLVDRRTDLIISGGVNIYPSETENALLMHDAVLDVAVIGVPHPEWGEKVVAVIELNNGYEGSEKMESELHDFCQKQIATFKCPRQIDFAKLPRTETGKLLRRKLKEQYAEL